MRVSTSLALWLVIACLHAPAHAADSIPLASARPGIVHTHPVSTQCDKYISVAQAVVGELASVPRGHRWVVVCSLDTWNSLLHKAGAWGRTNTAFTNETGHTTYINGAVFEESESFYRRVIYHEAGHAICACGNERKANEEAQRLVTMKVSE